MLALHASAECPVGCVCATLRGAKPDLAGSYDGRRHWNRWQIVRGQHEQGKEDKYGGDRKDEEAKQDVYGETL